MMMMMMMVLLIRLTMLYRKSSLSNERIMRVCEGQNVLVECLYSSTIDRLLVLVAFMGC